MEKSSGERWFWSALAFCALFHAAHALTLPILVTYDGSEYVRLADVLFSPRLMEEYCFRRPPIYPLALKASFLAFGRQPLSAQVPNLILGFGGIALLALSLRRMGRPVLGALCALVMTLDPVLISYEHALLTEASSFFFLALLLYALLRNDLKPAAHSFLVGLSVALAFYHRPTLLYLAPVAALLHGVHLLLKQPQRDRAAWLLASKHFLAATMMPFVIAFPWNRLLAQSKEANFGQQVLLYGALKQAVVSPGDPVLGNSQAAYQAAIAACSPGGTMDLAGLTMSAMRPIEDDMLTRCEREGYAIFLSSVSRNPAAYAKGVGRSLLYFAGLPNNDSENRYYVRSVITEAAAGSKLQGTNHHLFAETQRDFTQKGANSLLARGLNRLYPLYRIMLPLGVLASMLGLIASIRRRDTALAAYCALPLAVLAMHALALLSMDRYVVPAMPLLLANVMIVPGMIFRRAQTSSAL